MDALLHRVDGYVILLYRMTGESLVDYFIGTFLLAMLSVAAGEATVLTLRRINSSHIERLDGELAEKYETSMQAKRGGHEAEYRELNRAANDAFGRVFFNMFTFSAALLWPAFMSLAWMQTRFMSIEFPVPFAIPALGQSVGYVFTFLLLYIMARIFMSNIKRAAGRLRDKSSGRVREDINHENGQ